MENILDFVNENSVLFIVGGVVIFLAIIGLIGEKIKKGKKEENKVEVINETPTKQEETQELFGQVSATENNLYENKETEFNYAAPVVETPSNEDLFAPLQTAEEVIPTVAPVVEPILNNEDLFQPITETPVVNEDFFGPMTENVETPVVSEDLFQPITETPVVNEDLFMPMPEAIETPKAEEIPVNNFQGFMGFASNNEETTTTEDSNTRF